MSRAVALVTVYSVYIVAVECLEGEFVGELVTSSEPVMAVAFEEWKLVSAGFVQSSDIVGVGAVVLVSGSGHGLFFDYYRWE